MKKRVVLGQLGWAYSDEIYLPLSAAMLAAHCNADPLFKENYEIDPWLRFARAEPQDIVDGFEVPPDVLGLSMYVWCEQISLAVAKLTKERWPNCLVVFGGPSVSDHHYAEALLRAHPYVDVIVHGEGEETFRQMLLEEAGGGITTHHWQQWEPLCPGVSFLRDFRVRGEKRYVMAPPRPREKNLDRFPSPFLDGTFDHLLATPAGKGVKFAGVWESNRGCPFACT